eukprot:XP_017948857.1 PREDICTED: uncharacterized protein LOC100495401 [Xenopus tropicalis]
MALKSFEDVAVFFSEEEWECLDGEQKNLYKEVMLENYNMLISLCQPALISNIERKHEPWINGIWANEEKTLNDRASEKNDLLRPMPLDLQVLPSSSAMSSKTDERNRVLCQPKLTERSQETKRATQRHEQNSDQNICIEKCSEVFLNPNTQQSSKENITALVIPDLGYDIQKDNGIYTKTKDQLIAAINKQSNGLEVELYNKLCGNDSNAEEEVKESNISTKSKNAENNKLNSLNAYLDFEQTGKSNNLKFINKAKVQNNRRKEGKDYINSSVKDKRISCLEKDDNSNLFRCHKRKINIPATKIALCKIAHAPSKQVKIKNYLKRNQLISTSSQKLAKDPAVPKSSACSVNSEIHKFVPHKSDQKQQAPPREIIIKKLIPLKDSDVIVNSCVTNVTNGQKVECTYGKYFLNKPKSDSILIKEKDGIHKPQGVRRVCCKNRIPNKQGLGVDHNDTRPQVPSKHKSILKVKMRPCILLESNSDQKERSQLEKSSVVDVKQVQKTKSYINRTDHLGVIKSCCIVADKFSKSKICKGKEQCSLLQTCEIPCQTLRNGVTSDCQTVSNNSFHKNSFNTTKLCTKITETAVTQANCETYTYTKNIKMALEQCSRDRCRNPSKKQLFQGNLEQNNIVCTTAPVLNKTQARSVDHYKTKSLTSLSSSKGIEKKHIKKHFYNAENTINIKRRKIESLWGKDKSETNNMKSNQKLVALKGSKTTNNDDGKRNYLEVKEKVSQKHNRIYFNSGEEKKDASVQVNLGITVGGNDPSVKLVMKHISSEYNHKNMSMPCSYNSSNENPSHWVQKHHRETSDNENCQWNIKIQRTSRHRLCCNENDKVGGDDYKEKKLKNRAVIQNFRNAEQNVSVCSNSKGSAEGCAIRNAKSSQNDGKTKKPLITYPGKRECTCITSDRNGFHLVKEIKCQEINKNTNGKGKHENGSYNLRQNKKLQGTRRIRNIHASKTNKKNGNINVSENNHPSYRPVTDRPVKSRPEKLHTGCENGQNPKAYMNTRITQSKSMSLHFSRRKGSSLYSCIKKGIKNMYSQNSNTVNRAYKKHNINNMLHKKYFKIKATWISHECNKCGKRFIGKIKTAKEKAVQNRKNCVESQLGMKNKTCRLCVNSINSTLTGNEDSTSNVRQTHTCSKCGKMFAQHSVFLLHERSHKEEKLHVCYACGKRFVQNQLLLRHEKIHKDRKPYQCMDCGRTFHGRELFVMHQRSHKEEKPFPCAECGKRFADNATLTVHTRIHTGEKPFRCSACGKCFSQHSTLVSHQRIHTGEKPYSCHYCRRRFSDRSSYATHVRTHTGEKPFNCSGCGKSFSQSSNLRRHERIHTGQKPYACSVCGKTFNDNTKLKSHQKTHNKEETNVKLNHLQEAKRKNIDN